jgi:hypothetical protein
MTNAFLQTFVRTVKANGGTESLSVTGTVFKCRKCSVPSPYVTVSFNDGSVNPLGAGDTFNLALAGASFTHLVLVNNHPTQDAVVTFQVGTVVVSFNPPDTQLASTYARGNLGLKASGDYVAGGTTQSITLAGNLITVPRSGFITVFGSDAGHQRKVIIFSCSNNQQVNVFDVNECFLFAVGGSSASLNIAIETDSVFKLQGAGADYNISIAEIYFSAL